MRIASSSTGATSLEAIPLDQIERIEILRGPASSLYGADAIGGVIQVFTRRGSGAVSGNASAGYGTYGTWDVNGGASGAAGPVQFALQAAAKGSKGFNTITDPANFLYNPDRDGYRNQSISASGGVTLAPEQQLSAQYFRSRLNNQFDGSPDFDDRTITVAETWQVASRNRLAEFWVSRLSAGEGIDDSQTQTGFGDFPFKTVQRQYAWQNDFALPFGVAIAGYERREERVSHRCRVRRRRRATPIRSSAFTSCSETRTRCRPICGTTSRANSAARRPERWLMAIAIAPSLRLTAGYSTGFKAPSFNDLYYPGFSNPNLVPETSHNLEAGAYWNANVNDASFSARADRVSQSRFGPDRLPMRRRLQLRPTERRPRHPRGGDARVRHPIAQWRGNRCLARPAITEE